MDSDTQNFYEILGVDRKATQAEIKKTFMKLAKENHPDKTSSLPEAERERREALFKQINEANETLSDPDKHAKYDFDLDNPKPQHAGPAASPVGRSPENFWRDPGRGSRGSRSGAHDNLYMELEDEFVKMFQRFEADRNNRFDGTGNPHGSRSSWQPKGPHLFRDEGRVPREPDLFQTNKHTEHSLDGTTSVWSFSLKFPSKRLKIYFQSRPRWWLSQKSTRPMSQT
ncbi:DnaJ-domain-containing protein [Amniculicola lignicola CBS 123094]|uniref:DnaJ-domain-containing protein n=1 Tax=Amniculicola lignicola CBS 123094 TaxID=1392246 RepID=A0A6A5WTI2_9PLEO|nr:DnaJ-domain-containing protein [Amniculicola lignicola CBS 123094]